MWPAPTMKSAHSGGFASARMTLAQRQVVLSSKISSRSVTCCELHDGDRARASVEPFSRTPKVIAERPIGGNAGGRPLRSTGHDNAGEVFNYPKAC